jgi:DNA-binding response OmpR family regulator
MYYAILTGGPAPPPRRAFMDADASVAIVDDEVQLVRTYEMLFKRRNIPMAFVAYKGEEAVEKFKNARPRPKIVIVDYRLPDMSGLEAMKGILATEPDTRIVFISGDESVRQESLDAGAAVFMKKPTPIREITDTITALMRA